MPSAITDIRIVKHAIRYRESKLEKLGVLIHRSAISQSSKDFNQLADLFVWNDEKREMGDVNKYGRISGGKL